VHGYYTVAEPITECGVMNCGIFFWFVLSVLVGCYWVSKGRSFIGGLLLSMLLSPPIGLLIGAILKPDIEGHNDKPDG